MQIDFLADPDRDHGDGSYMRILEPTGDSRAAGTTVPWESSEVALDEAEARRLEKTGRFRVLRRLEHRPICADARPANGSDLRLGVAVDTETTGLDASRCEVIEIAAVAFTYDDERIHDVVGVFEGLQQPRFSLPPEIVRLTGLTDADVKGRSIDREALADFVRPADLIVAHNAAFDRPFCEKLEPIFASKTWACSANDVSWQRLGADSAKLVHLLASVGSFHGAHRALTDCHALLEILCASHRWGTGNPFSQLLQASKSESYEIRAERTPYAERAILKSRGYRWSPGTDGRPKCWMKVVGKGALDDEVHFLRREIYRGKDMPVVRSISVTDRYR